MYTAVGIACGIGLVLGAQYVCQRLQRRAALRELRKPLAMTPEMREEFERFYADIPYLLRAGLSMTLADGTIPAASKPTCQMPFSGETL